ncbi:MAG: DegT/DnrJ/EryC1/StrS family aminotransferase [Parachlamydiaceae bacterium]|nr:DegT/DnrJ/EryC1/StrS family aminotransferase [Parachlamydiaceae bacterium]
MSLPFLPYTRQSIREGDIRAVSEALQDDIITRGSRVDAFERVIAEYCGAQYAVAFNNGTSALMAAYFAANLTPYDRVVSTPNSFIATIGSAIHSGIYPHFGDIDRNTGNLDLHKLKSVLDFHSTRGRLFVVPVHFAGIPVDIQALDRLLRSQIDFVIIEDAAQALGSSYSDGTKVGCCARSQMTVFSFHPAKIITTGEGGMVTTNDPELYHRLRLFRNNGIERDPPYLKEEPSPGYYEIHAVTGNYNFTDFQAALGMSQMRMIDKFIEKRRRLVKQYRNQLYGILGIKLLTDEFDQMTAFHLFVVQLNFARFKTNRTAVMEKLKKVGVGTQVHYIPLYRHPALSNYYPEDIQEQFPEMEGYYAEALSLPLYYDLNESDVERVCHELKIVLGIN